MCQRLHQSHVRDCLSAWFELSKCSLRSTQPWGTAAMTSWQVEALGLGMILDVTRWNCKETWHVCTCIIEEWFVFSQRVWHKCIRDIHRIKKMPFWERGSIVHALVNCNSPKAGSPVDCIMNLLVPCGAIHVSKWTMSGADWISQGPGLPDCCVVYWLVCACLPVLSQPRCCWCSGTVCLNGMALRIIFWTCSLAAPIAVVSGLHLSACWVDRCFQVACCYKLFACSPRKRKSFNAARFDLDFGKAAGRPLILRVRMPSWHLILIWWQAQCPGLQSTSRFFAGTTVDLISSCSWKLKLTHGEHACRAKDKKHVISGQPCLHAWCFTLVASHYGVRIAGVGPLPPGQPAWEMPWTASVWAGTL